MGVKPQLPKEVLGKGAVSDVFEVVGSTDDTLPIIIL